MEGRFLRLGRGRSAPVGQTPDAGGGLLAVLRVRLCNRARSIARMAIARPAHFISRRTFPNSPMRFAADDCARPWRRARARFSGGIHRRYTNIPGAAAFRGTTLLRPRKICRRLEKTADNVALADKTLSQPHFTLQRIRISRLARRARNTNPLNAAGIPARFPHTGERVPFR